MKSSIEVDRRRVLACLAAGLAGSAGATGTVPARPDAWPQRPITLVVPYPAGGLADNISRIVVKEVGIHLGQQVVVDNRPGASGKIGLDAVRRAAPDGYTLALAVPSSMVLLPLADPKYGIDARDFEPLSLACETYTVLVVPPRTGIRTLRDFVEQARAQGGDGFTYATPGNGTSFHFDTVLLTQKLGIRATHVPYKGESPALNDVVAGHVQFMQATQTAKPFIDGGKLTALAVASPQRVAALPQVPTFRELGIDFQTSGWLGYVAPRGLPSEIRTRLDDAFQRALRSPGLRQKLDQMGCSAPDPGALAMSRAIDQGLERFRPLVKSGAVQLD